MRSSDRQHRQALFDLLQPVVLSNCEFVRLGEPNDGGYLMCGNLLDRVEAGYSYGIANYDQWGCDIATRLGVVLHQYRLLRHPTARVFNRQDRLSRRMCRGRQKG